MSPIDDTEQLVRRMAKSELSMTSRLGYVALLLVASAMTVIIVSLLTTEAGVPARTRTAFVIMGLIGVSWIGLATWALTTSRPLAARDRVIAGWMAVTFTSLFVVVTALVALISRDGAGWRALALGLGLLWLAIQALRKARRRYAELIARRAQLEAMN